MLFYPDDFMPRSSSFPKGFSSAFYVVPLGHPYKNIFRQSSIRIVTLIPTSVSQNNGLDFIVDDAVKCAMHGIETVNFDGDKLKDNM